MSWFSSDESVAIVAGNGYDTATVEAKNIGCCTITATSSNGKKVTCSVTVEPSTMTDLSAGGHVANSYIVLSRFILKLPYLDKVSTNSIINLHVKFSFCTFTA